MTMLMMAHLYIQAVGKGPYSHDLGMSTSLSIDSSEEMSERKCKAHVSFHLTSCLLALCII